MTEKSAKAKQRVVKDEADAQARRLEKIRQSVQPEPAPLVYAPPDEPSWWAKARAWLGL